MLLELLLELDGVEELEGLLLEEPLESELLEEPVDPELLGMLELLGVDPLEGMDELLP